MSQIALFTYGTFRTPVVKNPSFIELAAASMSDAEASEGFIDRASETEADRISMKSYWDRDFGAWGNWTTPIYYEGRKEFDQFTCLQTLSVWENLVSVKNYTYRRGTAHLESVKRAREWGDKGRDTFYVVWWIENDVVPTWAQACKRHEYLDENGPSPYAFNFRSPFDSSGKPTSIK